MAEDSTRRSFGDDMLRPSPNHGTQGLPNDDDDDLQRRGSVVVSTSAWHTAGKGFDSHHY